MTDTTTHPTTLKQPTPPEATYGYTTEGIPIVAVQVVVRRTGDGLSDAMEAQPINVGALEMAYVAMRVQKIHDHFVYDTVNGFTVATRVQVFNAKDATFVEPGSVTPALEATAAVVAEHKSLKEADQPSFHFDAAEEDRTGTCRHCDKDIARDMDEGGIWFHVDSGVDACVDGDATSLMAEPKPKAEDTFVEDAACAVEGCGLPEVQHSGINESVDHEFQAAESGEEATGGA